MVYESISTGSVLDLVLELSHTIERLGIHSEILFDALHGIPADKHGSPTRDKQLSRPISVRQGAVALYQACQRSTTKCELGLDLLRDRSMPSDPNNAPRSASDANPFYHILVETANDFNAGVWNLNAEGLDDWEAATIRPKIETHEKPDLAVFEPKPLLGSHIICIQPSYSEESCYFRVAGAHTDPGSRSECELSALGLKTNKTSTKAGPLQFLTLTAKIDLAYNLVQCALYLLGTSWLASLSSKYLRGFETKDRRVCVLRVDTMALEYIWFDNPDGLMECSQLFRIGVILIEIALDSTEVSDLAKDEDPRLFVSKTLPLVYKAVGSDYYRACAFCVHDRGPPSSYGQHHKYEYPEQTGWELYTKGLLMEYHVQVVSR